MRCTCARANLHNSMHVQNGLVFCIKLLRGSVGCKKIGAADEVGSCWCVCVCVILYREAVLVVVVVVDRLARYVNCKGYCD